MSQSPYLVKAFERAEVPTSFFMQSHYISHIGTQNFSGLTTRLPRFREERLCTLQSPCYRRCPPRPSVGAFRGLGFRVQGFGFRGLGFRVQGFQGLKALPKIQALTMTAQAQVSDASSVLDRRQPRCSLAIYTCAHMWLYLHARVPNLPKYIN